MMPAKRLGLLDKILLLISLVGAISVGYVLLHEDVIIQNLLRRQAGDHKIGKIVRIKNDARTRRNESLTWYPALSNENLFERDSLFTGAESEIDFIIDKKQSIHLNSNCLLVLQLLNDEIIFNLQLGSMSIKSLDNTPVKILSNGKVTTLKPSESEIPLQMEAPSISTPSPTPTLAPAPTPSPTPAPEPNPTPPQTSTPIATPTQTPTPKTKHGKPKPKATPVPTVAPSLAPAIEKPKAEPAIPLESPALLSPADKTILVNFNSKEISPTLFAWKKVDLAEEYEIQFAQDVDFKNVLLLQKTTANQFVLKKILGKKPLLWRVRAKAKDSTSEWSSPRSFEMQISE
jgi:hypothetical protein